MDSRPLAGKAALITGSTQGLGLAVAHALAASGCHIVLSGLDESGQVDALRRALGAHGVGVIYSDADLRRPVEIDGMMDDAEREFGAVDILVNNAVVRHAAPVETFPVDRWDEALAVNLSAAFHTIQRAVPPMKARTWGRIINVSSIYGLRGAPNRVGYVTTKTALLGLTRAVALEIAGHGITCNAVCPGTTDTPVHRSTIQAMTTARGLSQSQAEQAFLAGKQPTGRIIPAARVAALVHFLCLPEADDITGAALPIDGGWSAA